MSREARLGLILRNGGNNLTYLDRPTLEDQIAVSKMTLEDCIKALKTPRWKFWIFCKARWLYDLICLPRTIYRMLTGGEDK